MMKNRNIFLKPGHNKDAQFPHINIVQNILANVITQGNKIRKYVYIYTYTYVEKTRFAYKDCVVHWGKLERTKRLEATSIHL